MLLQLLTQLFIQQPEILLCPLPALAVAGIALGAKQLLNFGNSRLGVGQQKELMDYQYNLERSMFDYANNYNKPINQMIRLREAGLNPNLVYGNGSVAGNVAGSAPSISIPGARGPETVGINDAISAYQLGLDTKIKESQLGNLEAQRLKTDAERIRIENETQSKEFYNLLNSAKATGLYYNNEYLRRTLTDRVEQEALRTTILKDESVLNGFRYVQEQNKIKIMDQQLENLKAQEKLTYASVSKVLADANLSAKQAELIVEKIDTQKALTKKEKAEINNLIVQGKTAKLEYVLKKYLPSRSALTSWLSDLDQHIKSGDLDDYIDSEF